MKKQYTTEEAYSGNTEINFYVDGSLKNSVIISDWKLQGYLEAKHEDGWEKAYSHEEMQETISKIKSLKEDLSWYEDYFEEIKNNLIGE